MNDWKGLYNWVNSQNEIGNKFDSNIPPLSKEQRDFLENAMKEYTVDECKRMKEIVDYLYNNAFIVKKEKLEEIQILFDELLDLLTGIDNGINLVKLGGNNILFALYQDSEEEMVKENSALILIEMTKNNPFVQLQNWEIIKNYLLEKILDYNDKFYFYNLGILFSLSTCLNLSIKREICQENIHKNLIDSLSKNIDLKAKQKIFQILIDLLENEDLLKLENEVLTNDLLLGKIETNIKYPELNNIIMNEIKNNFKIFYDISNDILKGYKDMNLYFLEYFILLMIKINDKLKKEKLDIMEFNKIKNNIIQLKNDKSEKYKESFELIKF